MKKYLLSATTLSILILPVLVLAQASPTPTVVASPSVSPSPTVNPGTLPDSSLYFLKSWKEKIQLFFTLNAEKKAQQYLRLAELRFAEYQKMLEKGKNQVAEKTLNKYQDQLDRALQKAEQLKEEGKDIKNLTEKLQQSTQNRLQVLQENLNKVPDQAKQGIQRAIDNSKIKLQRFQERFNITPSPTILPTSTSTISTTPTPNESVSTRSITVISPNGGERWEIGKTYNITWRSSGISNDNKKVNIMLQASTPERCEGDGYPDCSYVDRLIASVPVYSGSFSWQILDVQARNNYRVSISIQGVEDKSDGEFSIVSSQ